jgi:Secretion system C-terminal sorting domain
MDMMWLEVHNKSEKTIHADLMLHLENHTMKNAVIFLLLVCSLTVSGQDTISHINGGCINSEKKIANDDSCPQGIFFEYENDSLNIFGTIGANCCGTHLAIIKSSHDTIFISTVDTGMLCTCVCEFCFNIRIPVSITDTIVNLNGTIYSTLKNYSSTIDMSIESYIELVPNPAKNNLTVLIRDYIEDLVIMELINAQGILLRTIKLNSIDNINVDLSGLKSGAYFIRFKTKNNNTFTKTIIKE